ncbi:hypothetical protein EYF80_000453 [Liparis tanakae]|uniref:Uncharacterized protein n=1 Tax=Liparis tanakae TaxID=230148 RepID=A0A4Z2JFZ5_9TELE|nr:hypothetical protein EYF80_000453 [Liparis tanakae]
MGADPAPPEAVDGLSLNRLRMGRCLQADWEKQQPAEEARYFSKGHRFRAAARLALQNRNRLAETTNVNIKREKAAAEFTKKGQTVYEKQEVEIDL